MIDFRSRAEKAQDARQLAKQESQALAKLEEMNATVANRLGDLETKTQALAQATMDTREHFQNEVSALNDDISQVHASIRAGAEIDREMWDQMQKSHERRINALMQFVQASIK